MCFWANDAFSLKCSYLFTSVSHQEPLCLHFQDKISDHMIVVVDFPSLCLSKKIWVFVSFELSARLEIPAKQVTGEQKANVKLCNSEEFWSKRAPNGDDLGFLQTEEPNRVGTKGDLFLEWKRSKSPQKPSSNSTNLAA